MASPEETLKQIQKALRPYIKPREEASQIRRVLALHLDACLEEATAIGPLSLVEANKPAHTSTSRGLQKEYLDALNANIRARAEFKACRKQMNPRRKEPTPDEPPKVDYLQEHLATLSLQKKHDRLLAVERHLDLLSQKPAASPSFLEPEKMFRDSRPLPNVPKDVVTALALNNSNPASSQLKDLIHQLERHVLRAKLQLKREEQLLEEVKSRTTVSPGTVSNHAKFEALNRTRTELINWIETELSAAGDGASSPGDPTPYDQTDMALLDEHIAGIKSKYRHYVEARKSLLHLVSQSSKPVIKPRTEATPQPPPPAANPPPPPPSSHLLAPYLEKLLAVAREQKGLIAQKSHLHATVTKQLKETRQALDRLAEESQLIPAHPMPGGRRHNPSASGGGGLGVSEPTTTLDASARVQPWVFAAESAKIAALEAVADKIEEGQAALDKSMGVLAEIDNQLLKGDEEEEEEAGGKGAGEESDIWLAEGKPGGKAAGAVKKSLTREKVKPKAERDVFELLDGTLGLLRSEGGTTP
ncbi:hypothetical protein B0T18DRAFT_484716 [Schizothecium vesticola]|uniref:Uncharacterized protein n=1 Tax=Schizothecium vesticola TaxID=314040 RepID=A0AA40FAF8_9PEZI|nr:hypothetical protein B0T18DRAFT_484716 [Schizothecium vesticola]